MARIVAQPDAGGESRRAGIEMALLTLRGMERWRDAAGDYNSAIILLAVVAISAEKLTRGTLDEQLRSLARPFPASELTLCNISSVAAATGFNRETTRRYVNRLIARELLERRDDGTLAFTAGYFQRAEIGRLLQTQLETFSRSANEFLRLGALVVQEEKG